MNTNHLLIQPAIDNIYDILPNQIDEVTYAKLQKIIKIIKQHNLPILDIHKRIELAN